MSSNPPGRTDVRDDDWRTSLTHLAGVLEYLGQELWVKKASGGRYGLASPDGEDVGRTPDTQGTELFRQCFGLFVQ